MLGEHQKNLKNLNSSCKFNPPCLFQEINYGSANILFEDLSFPPILLDLIVFVNFHILNRQSGLKGWNLSRHCQLIKLMQAEIRSFTPKQQVQIADKPTVDRHNTKLKLNYCLLTVTRYYLPIKNREVCAGMPRCSVFLTWCTGRLFTPPSSYISSMLRNHMACLLIIIYVISKKHLNIINGKIFYPPTSPYFMAFRWMLCTFFLHIFIFYFCRSYSLSMVLLDKDIWKTVVGLLWHIFKNILLVLIYLRLFE